SFEPSRVAWRVRAGSQEPTTVGAPPMRLELTGDDKHRVIAAVGLGHTTDATRYGIAFGAKPSLELRTSYATVVARHAGGLEILAPNAKLELGPKDEAVQLPLLAEDGKLTSYA